MKKLIFSLVFAFGLAQAQNIRSIQLFNPRTNDETAVIGFNEQLVLRFDDLSNTSEVYRYTIRHLDRNWQPDNLFFTEYANGSMNGLLNDFRYSFNTLQKYTHYQLIFPNEKIQPKISGNYELVVYKSSPEKPLFTKRFSVVEDAAKLGLQVTRTTDAARPQINQRVEVQAVGPGVNFNSKINSVSLSVIQNNNWQSGIFNLRPSSTFNNRLMFQQPGLSFPGNNEFYYFDNKIIGNAFDMVAGVGQDADGYRSFLHPVWAYPLNYQYMPDVNGAFYFRRNDVGTERDADREGDYSWVYFSLESEKMPEELYVLGGFNDYQPSEENRMRYDEAGKRYIAKIYLKQGFYNYILATKDSSGSVDLGKINGNFWETENLYQAFLYYRHFSKNYDGLIGYGEYRTPVR